jgi:hypothetical protein
VQKERPRERERMRNDKFRENLKINCLECNFMNVGIRYYGYFIKMNADRSQKVQNFHIHKGGDAFILTNVFPSEHLHPGYLSWYKQRATTTLPSARKYMKCISASS